jgi:hypothetical protein
MNATTFAAKEDEVMALNSWRSSPVLCDEGIVYIQDYKGSPIKMNISIFKASGTKEKEKE